MLVDVEWLRANLQEANLILLDASYPKVTGEKSPYEGLQIIGSRRFDIDNFSDQNDPLPHMLCSAEDFQEKARALGINQDSCLVVYDNFGIYSAPRAWWMFKAMGHYRVKVLNGGLREWIERKYPTEKVSKLEGPRGNFIAEFQQDKVRSFNQIETNISVQDFQVIDARSSGRFVGTSPEPRPELPSGHIPNSSNVPFPEVLQDHRFKSAGELREVFERFTKEKPIVFSCGSGLSACITLMAAQQVLKNSMAIYDGSWTEWASRGGQIDKDK